MHSVCLEIHNTATINKNKRFSTDTVLVLVLVLEQEPRSNLDLIQTLLKGFTCGSFFLIFFIKDIQSSREIFAQLSERILTSVWMFV